MDPISDASELRAYLQRGETRLSIMHGVASAFISGAGLLLLVPILLNVVLQAYVTQAAAEIQLGLWESAILILLWPIPLLLAALLPLYALYRTIEQLVQLYFMPDTRGVEAHLPVFQPPALAYPLDASPSSPSANDDNAKISTTKRMIVDSSYREENINLVLPRSKNDALRAFFASLLDGGVVTTALPTYRRSHQLTLGEKGYNAAVVTAGLVDRTLIDEAANMESMLVRFNLRLRVLVVRYAKALLIAIWSLVILSGGAPLILLIPKYKTPTAFLLDSFAVLLPFIIGSAWTVLTPIVTHRPIKWIWATGDPLQHNIAIRTDPQLRRFEAAVIAICGVSAVTGLIGELSYVWQHHTGIWPVLAISLSTLALVSFLKRIYDFRYRW